jgi:Fic family protein
MIHLLVHHLTKLFQNHRIIRNKRIVEIAEEDILTALAITGNLLNPEAFLTRIQRQHFIQLQLAFKSQIFTSKQAQKALLMSKSHSNRILKLLADQKLLQLIKRKDKHAFLHQIVFGKTTKS